MKFPIAVLAAAYVGVANPALAEPAPAAQAAAAPLIAAISGAHRGNEARARDVHRHPRETLQFFGLQPDMTVVEILPGGGWYADIIAPTLRAKGRYVAALPDTAQGPENYRRMTESFRARLTSDPDLYGKPTFTNFGKGVTAPLVAPGTADMVLTFRNAHNWVSSGFAAAAFKSFYAALKPGGILGVVDHRLPEDRDVRGGKNGYLKVSEVIRLAEDAGFRLDSASEINANSRDTADHPKGVWTLPPTFALGDVDRAKWEAIGESDRMTLRFVKPQ